MADWESSDYPRSYKWRAEDGDHLLELVPVAGTNGAPYLFGSAPNRRAIDIGDFCIMSTPVTQALWRHVIGAAPSSAYHPDRPVDSISWDRITGSGGFLERINSTPSNIGIDLTLLEGATERSLKYRQYAIGTGLALADLFRIREIDLADATSPQRQRT